MDESPRRPVQMVFGKIDDIASRVAAAVDGARRFLFSTQDPEGFWCGELEADYILLHTLLGTRDEVLLQKAAREIIQRQNEDGGWPIFHGGPSNISATVKAYLALKLTGHKPDDPILVRARERIFALGGVTAV